MKPLPRMLIVCLVLACASVLALAKQPKPGPLNGTWECTSHGSPQGDLQFTLYLTQNGDSISGSVNSPLGSTELSSVTFKKKLLDIHIDTPQGNYTLSAKYKKGQLLGGQWNTENEKGTWEGKKTASTTNQ